MRGSAIYRIGYERWLRNIAVALGNARATPEPYWPRSRRAREHPSALVREHVQWALRAARVSADRDGCRQRAPSYAVGAQIIDQARAAQARAAVSTTSSLDAAVGALRSAAFRIAK